MRAAPLLLYVSLMMLHSARVLPAVVELTPESAVHFKRVSSLRFSPDAKYLVGVVSEQSGGSLTSHLWMLRVATPDFRQFTFSTKAERSPEWSPNGQTLAFLSTRDGSSQVYLVSPEGGEARAATSGEAVRDFHWSPDGKQIAYLAKESAARPDSDPVVADRPEDLARIWCVDVESGHTRQITRGPWRIDEFAWPSADRILSIATDDPRREIWNTALYGVSLRDGSLTQVARLPQPFGGLSVSPHKSTMALVATRNAGPEPNDLYLAGVNGGTWRDATASLDRTVKDVRWQNESTPVVRVVDGFNGALFRINGIAQRVPVGASVASFDIASDGTLAFAPVAFDRLQEVFLKRGSAAPLQVSDFNADWRNIRLSNAEFFKFKSFDGVEVEAALFQPLRHRAKSPLVLLVHGGPASSFSADYAWFNSWAQLLATRGYAVLLVNPRGSVGYGEDFEKANRGDLGGNDFKDLMAAVDTVLARGDIDPDKLGIGGWSYGGQMTVRAITQTHRFKAAVVGGGVFDESAEYGTEDDPASDEWYMGTPWENPEIYARNSPATYIRNATTPTLILHGAADSTNPVGQSQALYRALKRYDVESQFVTYPREGHLPREEAHQIDVLRRMLDWFDAHLQ